MHLSLLFTLSLLSLALPSLGSPADRLYVVECTSDYGLIADNGPDFSSLNQVFTDSVIYNTFAESGVPIRGLAKVELFLTKNLPNGTITLNAITTQSISLSGFDSLGGASAARSVSYDSIKYFGRGNLTGQTATVYVKHVDTLIKTDQKGNAGWRISERKETLVGTDGKEKNIFPPLVTV